MKFVQNPTLLNFIRVKIVKNHTLYHISIKFYPFRILTIFDPGNMCQNPAWLYFFYYKLLIITLSNLVHMKLASNPMFYQRNFYHNLSVQKFYSFQS